MIELSHIEKKFGDNTVLKDVSVTFAELLLDAGELDHDRASMKPP